MRRFCLALTVALVSLGVQASPAAGSLPNYLPDCQGVPVHKPSTIVFACGDGNIFAKNVRWRNWGACYAHGSGMLSMNDYDPDCANGHFRTYHLSLIAFGSQVCP